MSFYDLIKSHIFLTLSKQFQREVLWRKAKIDYNKLQTSLDSKVTKLADKYMQLHGPLIAKYNMFVLAIPELDSDQLFKVAAVI
jgi:hypothetical protein